MYLLIEGIQKKKSSDKLRLLESTALTEWGTIDRSETNTDPEFDFVLISDILPPRPSKNVNIKHYEKSFRNG